MSEAAENLEHNDLEEDLSTIEDDDEPGGEPDEGGETTGSKTEEPPPQKPAAPDAAKLQEEVENYKRALVEERTKRQEAQRLLEFNIFQARHAAAQPQTPAKKEEDDDAITPLVKPVLDKEISPISQELRQVKAQLSEQQARGRYKDYDHVVAKVLPTIQQDPSMFNLFLQAPDPAEFAYRMGVFLTIDDRIAAAREEGRREALAGLKKTGDGSPPPAGLSDAASGKRGGAGAGDGEDISVEAAAKLSPQEWAKLPEKTRRRLLGIG